MGLSFIIRMRISMQKSNCGEKVPKDAHVMDTPLELFLVGWLGAFCVFVFILTMGLQAKSVRNETNINEPNLT